MLLNETIATFKDGTINLELKKREIFVVHEKNSPAVRELRYSVFDCMNGKTYDFKEIGTAIGKFEMMINVNYFLYD